ncbi:MAG TPA: 3-dehydroquinate synthase family protein [Bryobacteraceae bacterium]|nr:3-dehydroquinate synthase family protein [Bryobacteraceae bacterium]
MEKIAAPQRLTFETERRTRTDYIVTSALLAEPAVAGWQKRETAIVYDSCLEHHHQRLLGDLGRKLSPIGSLAVAGGEGLKDISAVIRIMSFLSEIGLPKHGLLIAVGGGTVCDAVSLSAILFRRGVSLALVPTTLLAQIDAAVGGKNGVNFERTKNLVGHFYHPETVVCDTSFIRTLPERDFVGGLAEAIKVLAVSDARRFHCSFRDRDLIPEAFSPDALSTLVADSVAMKLALLGEDPFELSSRRLLNYGHAFAHNFEEESQFDLSHGEAVLVGMTIENTIAQELNLASAEIDSLQAIITGLFTEQCRRYWIDRSELPPLLTRLRLARRNRLNLVCLRSIGDAEIIDDVDTTVMLGAWDRSRRILMGSNGERSASAWPAKVMSTSASSAPLTED